jgi:hypothetical protein
MKKLSFLSSVMLLAAVLFLTSCQKENKEIVQDANSTDAEKIIVPAMANSPGIITNHRNDEDDYNTFYGPVVQMGNGHARSWVNITRSGHKPKALGIELTAGALQNLPTDPLNFAANTFVLTLHQKARAVTPFDHITLNWEPTGHEPPGIYDVPHFDMHFYKISVAAQMAITGIPGPPPPPGYLPASYVIQAATVPQMGTHWIDPSSPELSPPFIFTHTFIYGSNNGAVHFLEPMITRAFLLAGTAVTKPFPQPTLFSPANTNYPTVYKIWKNNENGKRYVALTDFIFR